MKYDFEKLLKSLIIPATSILKTDNDDPGTKIEKEITYRAHLYSDLLNNYVSTTTSRNRHKETHKWIFFWCVMAVFVVCLVFICIVTKRFLSIKNEELLVNSIPVLVTAFVSLISTIIILPSTIAKFLFNTKEDEYITSVIVHTQEHDAEGMTLLKNRFDTKGATNNQNNPISSDDAV